MSQIQIRRRRSYGGFGGCPVPTPHSNGPRLRTGKSTGNKMRRAFNDWKERNSR